MEEIIQENREENSVSQPTVPPRALPVDRERLHKFTEILLRYQKGKANLDNRIIDNEQWWKLRHWEQIREKVQPNSKERITPGVRLAVQQYHQ